MADVIRGWTTNIEKAGYGECKEHDWVYANTVVMTHPPIYHRICSKCGQVEEQRPICVHEPDYDTIFRQFHCK